MGVKTVIAIPDTHFPWVDPKALDLVLEAIEGYRPDIVIQLGDLFDAYAHSKYARSHGIMTPKQEIVMAKEQATNMWSDVRKKSPKSKCFQLRGNHDTRPEKRILEKHPEIESYLNLEAAYTFQGVQTIFDVREELEIDGVIYTHGFLTNLGDHAKHFRKPCVHGHSHKGGTKFFKYDKLIWELDAGFLGDRNAEPLSYSATKTNFYTLGFGMIDELGPRFIPLED